MRTVLLNDVAAAARVLLGVPKFQRARLCARMLREADEADRYLRKQGKLHPKWGNGTLLAVARTRPLSSEPSFDDVDYCSCFELVLRGLRCHLRAASL